MYLENLYLSFVHFLILVVGFSIKSLFYIVFKTGLYQMFSFLFPDGSKKASYVQIINYF